MSCTVAGCIHEVKSNMIMNILNIPVVIKPNRFVEEATALILHFYSNLYHTEIISLQQILRTIYY